MELLSWNAKRMREKGNISTMIAGQRPMNSEEGEEEGGAPKRTEEQRTDLESEMCVVVS